MNDPGEMYESTVHCSTGEWNGRNPGTSRYSFFSSCHGDQTLSTDALFDRCVSALRYRNKSIRCHILIARPLPTIGGPPISCFTARCSSSSSIKFNQKFHSFIWKIFKFWFKDTSQRGCIKWQSRWIIQFRRLQLSSVCPIMSKR